MTITDQATLIYHSFNSSAPELPVTTGNTVLLEDFLKQDGGKNEIHVVARGTTWLVKGIHLFGVPDFIDLHDGAGNESAISVSILVQEDAHFEIVSVNNFNHYIEQHADKVIES